MDVGNSALREVVVDDQVHALKVDAAGHEVRADQHPGLPPAEAPDDGVALFLSSVGVNDVDVQSIKDQFLVEFLGPVLALEEDEHRRLDALLHPLAHGQELPLLAAHEHQL
eukprot:CAMPEP_0194691006 /NCGR_PEP_ID=MMETSP0295-20121207/18742_1 /TAXON_ID=39354 /ORGANISM="Heterosigma akashiwo, Strain CCMP2393" /LENGTH=110 /DNA_ID=CAMNT_0039580741 /DNA_START=855 /DNA_END=1184 /DNA_ORIENTATION=-